MTTQKRRWLQGVQPKEPPVAPPTLARKTMQTSVNHDNPSGRESARWERWLILASYIAGIVGAIVGVVTLIVMMLG